MYKISTTKRFEKDYSKCIKKNLDISLLVRITELLEISGKLPSKNKPHPLKGEWNDHWECHIKGDWLLIWLINEKKNEIILVRTGTHSQLFK